MRPGTDIAEIVRLVVGVATLAVPLEQMEHIQDIALNGPRYPTRS